MNEQLLKLGEIKTERDSLLKNISIEQARVAELNIQRQNIIMGKKS